MESAAIRVLALLGVAAVAVCVVILFVMPLVAALDGALQKWRRLGLVPRVVAVLMAAVATVEAQKSGMGDSNRVERVDRVDGGGGDFSRKEHKESVWGDGEVLKLGVEVEQRTDKPSAVQLGLETSTHRLVSVKTNDSYSYSMPENAVRYPNWWIRGGYEDVFKLDLGDWRFLLGTNLVDYLWVYTWGKVRPRLKAKELEVAAVGAPMSAVPQVSEFWYMDGTNGSKILTWHNFFVGRIPISELDGGESGFSRVERVDRVEGDELDFNTETQRHREKSSFVPQSLCASVLRNLENELHVSTHSTRLNNSVVPISAQLELFPNGDYIARSNLVERYFKRVNPNDFDDDGIPNDIDESPSVSDGAFFGPDNDLPEGANSNNYCWVDVVVSNANSLVTFIGDKPSNLPDPCFIAKPDVTNRVTLLIGKSYSVTSAQPIILTAKSSEDIEVSINNERSMTIVWPVSYEIVDLARSASKQVRIIPPLQGTFSWSTNACCKRVQINSAELPRCAADCNCEGCSLGGFDFLYDGYSLTFDGIECGCSPYWTPEEDEESASISVSFSEPAVLFENSYANAPGEVVPRKSSTVTATCNVSGGKNGGMYTFSLVNGNKLRQISGVSFPISGTVAPEQQLSLEMKYESNEASDSKEDIKLIAEFQEYMTNLHLNDEAKLTSIRLEVVADADYPTNKIRHVFGPVERAEIKQFPEEPRVLCAKFFSYGGKIEDDEGRLILTSPYAALTFDADFFVGDSRIDSFAMEFRTIEPVSLRGENARAANEAEIYLHNSQNGNIQIPDFSDGFIGVLMHIDVMVDPQYVNFEKVRIFEGYAPPINRTGWYLDYDLFPDHFLEHRIENGAVEDDVLSATRVMTGNQLDGGDLVGSWIPTSDEYYSGSYSLDIPVKWFAVGNMNQLVSQPKLLMTSTQTISVFSNGTMKVQKFGKSLQGTESSQ